MIIMSSSTNTYFTGNLIIPIQLFVCITVCKPGRQIFFSFDMTVCPVVLVQRVIRFTIPVEWKNDHCRIRLIKRIEERSNIDLSPRAILSLSKAVRLIPEFKCYGARRTAI